MTQSRSQELFAEALRYIPGGVNSPVRAFRAVGGTPFFVRKAYGAQGRGCRRQRLHRLCLHVGPVDSRPRAAGGDRGGEGGGGSRHEFRNSQSARGGTGAQNLRMGAFGGQSAHDQQRHRGDDDRSPPRARFHAPRQDHQVRGLLPRPCRFAAGEGRLGGAHARPARQRGHSGGAGGADDRAALQRRGCVARGLCGQPARDRGGDRRADSRPTPGLFFPRPVFSRRCANSARRTARC